MGMYDSVWVKCPKCGEENEFQSKSGECILGFYNLQKSKIDASGVRNDFKEVYIVDPATSNKTKKDIFKEILLAYGYQRNEVLVIGDDPESEIRAGNELNIETVLYDKYHRYSKTKATYSIDNFKQLANLFKQPFVK